MTVNVGPHVYPHYPHRVSVPWRSTGQWRDVQIWLLDNVPCYDNYAFVGVDIYIPSNRIYYFAHEKDAMLFALKWS